MMVVRVDLTFVAWLDANGFLPVDELHGADLDGAITRYLGDRDGWRTD